MAEIITLLIDIALGSLAYRLALENRKQIKTVVDDVIIIKAILKKAGLLDVADN